MHLRRCLVALRMSHVGKCRCFVFLNATPRSLHTGLCLTAQRTHEHIENYELSCAIQVSLLRFRWRSHAESALPCVPGNLSSHMYLSRTFNGWNGHTSRCLRVHAGLQRQTALLPATNLFSVASRRRSASMHSIHVSFPTPRCSCPGASRWKRAAPSCNPHGPLHK